ncbi:hypothetical protein WA026_022360 [Henosepilachna vigintioctopunctata]|uniref:Uncharacterized protein n=1 Tax=Henosepilachna vigintioctopunctata TaxID=420089 RepID=A0AAW1UYA8_9CUCU
MEKKLKRAGRSNNIVVFGIEEKEKSTMELLRELKENIKQDFNIDIVNNEVNKIHRIGKKDPESNKPRPIYNHLPQADWSSCLKEDEKLIELTHAIEHIKRDVIGLLEEAFADWLTDLQKIKKSQLIE